MIQYEQISKLNSLESLAYETILKNPDSAITMTIRDFARTIHVSPTTVVRMANKLGFSGWNALKDYLENQQKHLPERTEETYDHLLAFELFLQNLRSPDYQKSLNRVAQAILDHDQVLFMGVGTSQALADYGSKYFNNGSLVSYVLSDPYQPVQHAKNVKTLAFILSLSGETEQVVHKLNELKRDGATVVVIANYGDNTMVKMSDMALTYNTMHVGPPHQLMGNLTTQLPVMAILEQLVQKTIHLKYQTQNNNIENCN